ncbi:MAG: adenylate/guanylate cyclase domain-containing protein [Actinomycetota bacterium]|nr:adenylate/guanylate cyclase domain-containing protein [Actinomycetota bacterium]
MVERPETRYARTSRGDSIAFQVCGRGDLDVVYVPNWASPIDLIWDHPLPARFLTRLASFSRLILFDKRGSGSSDHVSFDALATLEDWTEDIATVMDAVGSERAALISVLGGCPIATFFAATYPDRVSALVLFNPTVRILADDDFAGVAPDGLEDRLAPMRAIWGTDDVVGLFAPSMTGDEGFRTWLARFCRVGNPPAMAIAVFRASLMSDVRATLPLIQTPTLVLQRADAEVASSRTQGRFLAEHIAGARYIEVPGGDLIPYVGEASALLDEIEDFLAGDRPRVSTDRVLATVLFTDIVASTKHAVRVGDRKWTALLDAHDLLVSQELERYRGRKVNPTGDGMLATFDGPARAVRCAQAICSAVRALGIEVRAGLHTGEIELRENDIGGIAVHIGQRVSARAAPGEVLVTRTVTDLVAGAGLEFDDRGDHELPGVPGSWRLLAVKS